MSQLSIEAHSKVIRQYIGSPDVDADVDAWARRLLMDVYEDIATLRETNGQMNFLIQYVDRQTEAFKDPEDDRDEPLCSCYNSECPLKNGKIPVAIQEADSLTAGLIEYRQQHAIPYVLHDAQDEWKQMQARVEDRLKRVVEAYKRNQVPADADTDGDELVPPDPSEVEPIESTAD